MQEGCSLLGPTTTEALAPNAGRAPARRPWVTASPPTPIPNSESPGRLPTIGAGRAAWEQTNPSLQRALAEAVAFHLTRGATLLGAARNVDALLLGAARTVDVIATLDQVAHTFNASLPADLAAAAGWLPEWGMTVKQRHLTMLRASAQTDPFRPTWWTRP